MPPGIREGRHKPCGLPVQWITGAEYRYGYIHYPGQYEGKWHIIVGTSGRQRTLCERMLKDEWIPGVHVDYTDPDNEEDICKLCREVEVGRYHVHPNAMEILVEGHWYRCLHCRRKFRFDTYLHELRCPHTGTDYRMEHLCCGESMKWERPQKDRAPLGRSINYNYEDWVQMLEDERMQEY